MAVAPNCRSIVPSSRYAWAGKSKARDGEKLNSPTTTTHPTVANTTTSITTVRRPTDAMSR